MKDRDNIRIYGDDAGGVWTATKGTTAPVGLAAPAVGYSEVGWLGEDGIDLDRAEDVAEFKAWQGGTLVRKKTTSVDDTFRFICLEETATTMGLFYKGVVGTPDGAATPTYETYAITDQAKSDERAWVVDFVDGTVTKRLVVPSGEITGRATVGHKNSDITMYEFTVTIYGDYEIIKSLPAA